MSLCRLMVMDFMERIGRWDNETGRPRYDRYDLLFGRSYAEGFLEEGYKKEPFYGFDLRKFLKWINVRLGVTREGRVGDDTQADCNG